MKRVIYNLVFWTIEICVACGLIIIFCLMHWTEQQDKKEGVWKDRFKGWLK